MIDQASTILAPLNETTVAEQEIGVLALVAGVASNGQDLLAAAPGNEGTWFATFLCDQDWYMTSGGVLANVRAPVITDVGWLGAGGANGRCWGPLAAKVEVHRTIIAPVSRYARFISASNATLRVYISSRGPQGQLP